MSMIWRILFAAAVLVAGCNAFSDEAPSHLTLTESALMLRLIDTDPDHVGSGGTNKRFLRRDADGALPDFDTEDDKLSHPSAKKDKAVISPSIQGLSGQIPTALYNFLLKILAQTNKP
ncbi:hypothetical protein P3T76_009332 [Phytophthora citrophthora]|uniref:RxLR effector protein n=1 Tax=Phytophthora citrophthora TaxID=4793 RepID=A0AAD9LJQ7_9STRA|nr:hypothetical protein P3T76_009332 [Phytophthora citrophthora]